MTLHASESVLVIAESATPVAFCSYVAPILERMTSFLTGPLFFLSTFIMSRSLCSLRFRTRNLGAHWWPGHFSTVYRHDHHNDGTFGVDVVRNIEKTGKQPDLAPAARAMPGCCPQYHKKSNDKLRLYPAGNGQLTKLAIDLERRVSVL